MLWTLHTQRKHSVLTCGGRGLEREREVLAIQVLNCRQKGNGARNCQLLCEGSSQHLPAVEPRALSTPYNLCGQNTLIGQNMLNIVKSSNVMKCFILH